MIGIYLFLINLNYLLVYCFKNAIYLNLIHNVSMRNMSQNKKEFSDKLKKRAIFEGFAVSGIGSIPGSSRLKLRTQALERWLANNYHSEMKWMESERDKA